MKNDRGYLVPEPIDPHEYYCFRVYVPKHEWYLYAFWGAYRFFGEWLAWARDPLKKGAQAAAVWRGAIDKAHEEFLATKGKCMPTITGGRVNPLAPCIFQLEIDGVWTDVFDASCCSGGGGSSCDNALRINNGQVERYNPDTGEWAPAGPQTPPEQQTSPVPPNPAARESQCLAATNAAHAIDDGKTAFALARASGAAFSVAFLSAVQFLVDLFGLGALLGTAYGWVNDLYQVFEAQAEFIQAYDPRPDLICMMLYSFDAQGRLSNADAEALSVAADNKADTYTFESAEWATWKYISGWIKSAGGSGMTSAAISQGITVGECDNCPWEVTFDFRVSPAGFTRIPVTDGHTYADGPYFGTWIDGQGWRSEVKPDAGSGHPQQRLAIAASFESCHIDSIRVLYLGDYGTDTGGDGALNLFVTGGTWDDGPLFSASPFANGETDATQSPDIDNVGALAVTGYIDLSGSSPDGAMVTVRQVTIRGTGTKPGAIPIP